MACHHAGLLYLAGKEGGYDVEKDVKKAPFYLNKACQEGIPESCYFLASHLMKQAKEMSSSTSGTTKASGSNENPKKKEEVNVVDKSTSTNSSGNGGIGSLFSSVADSFTKKKGKENETAKLQKELCLTAKTLLEASCEKNSHGQSCYNLAVMYNKGDLPGIPRDMQKFEKYKKMTQEIVKETGALSWQKGH